MLTIKASVKPSKIHGIGLFADEDIKKGTLIWKFDPRFDLLFEPKEVSLMPQIQKDFIVHYAYLSKATNKYVLSIDNGRFLNHSTNNNIDEIDIPEPEGGSIANRDIKAGEELNVDYRAFDANDAVSDEEYLKR